QCHWPLAPAWLPDGLCFQAISVWHKGCSAPELTLPSLALGERRVLRWLIRHGPMWGPEKTPENRQGRGALDWHRLAMGKPRLTVCFHTLFVDCPGSPLPRPIEKR